MEDKELGLEEVLEIANDINIVKKAASKNLNAVKSDCSKATGIDKKILGAAKSLYCTKGNGWTTNPLELDPDEQKKDKISVACIKFAEVITTMVEINPQDLKPYLDALKSIGIEVSIPDLIEDNPDGNEDALDAMQSMKQYQNIIDEKADELKEIAARYTDLVPEKEFAPLLRLYGKKLAGKETDDEYQDKMLYLELTGTAFSKVYDEM